MFFFICCSRCCLFNYKLQKSSMAAAPLFPIALPLCRRGFDLLGQVIFLDKPFSKVWKFQPVVTSPSRLDGLAAILKTNEDWPYNFGGLGCFDLNVYINWKILESFFNWNRCKNRLCFLERRGLDSVVFGRCWKFKIETVGVQMAEDSYVATRVETACWLSMNSLKGDFLATQLFSRLICQVEIRSIDWIHMDTPFVLPT